MQWQRLVSVSGAPKSQGFVQALSLHVYIQIYFQVGKLQMKSWSPEFPQIPNFHQLTAKKTATGNGNLQPEMDSNEYSSSCGNPTGGVLAVTKGLVGQVHREHESSLWRKARPPQKYGTPSEPLKQTVQTSKFVATYTERDTCAVQKDVHAVQLGSCTHKMAAPCD